mmetsp:Transcript_16219/g.40905  ORF Transcript_16219/g.40905 Transcript_16219/m.40905 type:complete len:225 (+) Transcript_16219:419-1093(+)
MHLSSSYQEHHIMAFRKRQSHACCGDAKLHVPHLDRRHGLSRPGHPVEGARDHAHLPDRLRLTRAVGSRCSQRRRGDARLVNRLVARRVHLVLLGQVDPDLSHFKRAASPRESLRVVLLVNDAARRRHPLHTALADDARVPQRVSVLDLSLERDGDGFEAAVWVLAHSESPPAGLELLRGGVVEHEEGRDGLGERHVREEREDVEAVAHPVGRHAGAHLPDESH